MSKSFNTARDHLLMESFGALSKTKRDSHFSGLPALQEL